MDTEATRRRCVCPEWDPGAAWSHMWSRWGGEKPRDTNTQGAHPCQQHHRRWIGHHQGAEISCNGSSWWGFASPVWNIRSQCCRTLFSKYYLECDFFLFKSRINYRKKLVGFEPGFPWHGQRNEMKLFLCITLNMSLEHFADARFCSAHR